MRVCPIIISLLVLSTLSLQATAEGEAAPVRRLVVLPFDGTAPEVAAKVAMKFRYKFRRTKLYDVPSEIETDEAVAAAGLHPAYATPPEEIAAFAREAFLADLAICGTVTPTHVKYRMIRCDDATVAAQGTHRYDRERDVSFVVEDLLDRMHDLDRELDVEKAREEDAPLGDNIVPNGDFERGGERPDQWADVDNLVVFYVTDDATHGRVMTFDTDVRLGEYQDWKARREAGASLAAAPKKTPVADPGYDTVAGTTGAPYRSDYFPVDASKAYRLTFDMKGPDGAKVFVKGYAKIGGQWREVGRAYKACRRKLPADQWETFTRTFHPFRWSKTRPIERLRIQLFPYWPRGTYRFDNVRVQEIRSPRGSE